MKILTGASPEGLEHLERVRNAADALQILHFKRSTLALEDFVLVAVQYGVEATAEAMAFDEDGEDDDRAFIEPLREAMRELSAEALREAQEWWAEHDPRYVGLPYGAKKQ